MSCHLQRRLVAWQPVFATSTELPSWHPLDAGMLQKCSGLVQTPALDLGVAAGGSLVPVTAERFVVISVLPGVLCCRQLCLSSTSLVVWEEVNLLQLVLDYCPNGCCVQGGGGGEVGAPQDQYLLICHGYCLFLCSHTVGVDKLLKELTELGDSGRPPAELLNGHLEQG